MPNYPAIPQPNPNDIRSLAASVQAMKEVLEILLGERGTASKAVVTVGGLPAAVKAVPGLIPTDGTDGSKGAPGRDGVDGEDAWTIPGQRGATGTQGTSGATIIGSDGDDGRDSFVPGPVGTPGVQGLPGIPGRDGDDSDAIQWFPPGSYNPWVVGAALIYYMGGNVGIGTMTPTDTLHVVDQNNAGVRFDEYSAADGAVIRLRRAQGTIASPTGLLIGNRIGAIVAFGYNSSGAFGGAAGAVSIYASETHTSSAHGSYIRLDTTPNGSTTAVERVRIDQDGNVKLSSYTTPGYLHNDASGNVTSKQPATFYAYMSTPQAIALGATSKLVLNSLVSNGGGYFDSVTNYRWTPPAGPVSLYGQALATSFTATDTNLVIIAKNGATLAQRVFGSKPGFMDGAITAYDTANGTDYYELFVSCAASTTSGVTVNDFQGNTFFTGVFLG